QNGQEKELVQRNFPSGSYLFELVPNQRFRVSVTRPGYQTASYTLSTNLDGVTTYGQPLFLLPGENNGNNANQNNGYPPLTPSTPTYPSAGSTTTNTNNNPPTTSPNPPTAPTTNNPPSNPNSTASSATYQGRYYKIQISAVKNFDPNEGQYQGVKAIGELGAETIPGRDLQRVTVGLFYDEEEAKNALRNVQQSGFPSAFTVRYDDGVRYGRVNL
ncbi:MAG: SPOR domain-containing protein, partial [Bacteroidota bacterium]